MNWKRSLGNNAPLLLAIISSVGVVGTALLVNKAAPEAKELIEEERYVRQSQPLGREPKFAKTNEPLTKTEIVKLTWKCYVPAIVMGTTTVACIFGSNALNKRQQAGIASAYALVASSYSKYKNKVLAMFGEENAQKIEQDLALDKRVKEVEEVTHPGEKIWFYDAFSDRFFEAVEQDVLLAEYDTNRKYAMDHEINLNTFYEFLDLEPTDIGTEVGWSLEASEAFYGYDWIEFAHQLCYKEDGTAYYKIIMPYPPTADYISDMPF